MTIKYEFQEISNQSNFQLIVFSTQKELLKSLNKDQSERLMTSDDHLTIHQNFDSIIIYIQLDDTLEKNRRLGATLFKSIKSLATDSFQVTGEFNYELIEGLFLSAYSFDLFKSSNKKLKTLIFDPQNKDQIEKLNQIVSAVHWSRDLVNTPFNHLGTQEIKENISSTLSDTNLKITFWDKKEIEKQNCGGIIAVNQASSVDPTFGILEHKPSNAENEKPIILVGKGVVYDTGGLSLKSSAGMEIMKCDMGGLASVVGTMKAITNLNLNKWVIALLPITDNLISNKAIAPGDVITMRSGSTVEVMNTDAEGRLILADALDYAKELDPLITVDLATLTGASLRAIGQYGATIMGTANSEYFHLINKKGNETGERIARLPFWDDYSKELESDIADLKNIGGSTAGAITAGKFLEHFVGYDWLHLDIAGPAYLSSAKHYNTSGGTGFGIRLLISFINEL